MKKTLSIIAFLSFLSCASASPKIESLFYKTDNGTVPPPYRIDKYLNIEPDYQAKKLNIIFELRNNYRTDTDPVKNGDIKKTFILGEEWFNEFSEKAGKIRVCDLGKEPKNRLIGGPSPYVIIKGENLSEFVRSGKFEGTELKFDQYNLCSKEPKWWEDLEDLFKKISESQPK